MQGSTKTRPPATMTGGLRQKPARRGQGRAWRWDAGMRGLGSCGGRGWERGVGVGWAGRSLGAGALAGGKGGARLPGLGRGPRGAALTGDHHGLVGAAGEEHGSEGAGGEQRRRRGGGSGCFPPPPPSPLAPGPAEAPHPPPRETRRLQRRPPAPARPRRRRFSGIRPPPPPAAPGPGSRATAAAHHLPASAPRASAPAPRGRRSPAPPAPFPAAPAPRPARPARPRPVPGRPRPARRVTRPRHGGARGGREPQTEPRTWAPGSRGPCARRGLAAVRDSLGCRINHRFICVHRTYRCRGPPAASPGPPPETGHLDPARSHRFPRPGAGRGSRGHAPRPRIS